MEGKIYFIQIGTDGPIKIGWAKNVARRMLELQTANPYKLNLLYEMEGTIEDEAAMQNAHRDMLMRGEWFFPTSGMVEYIEHLKKSVNEEKRLAEIYKKKYESRDYYDVNTGVWIVNAEVTLGEHLKQFYGEDY